jgi:hypothetical protein
MLLIPVIAALVVGPQAGPGPQRDWIIPTNVQVAHFGGEFFVRDLVIEEGAVLRVNPDAAGLSPTLPAVWVPQPLHVHASGTIRIEGTLELSGARAYDVDESAPANRRQFGGRTTNGGQRGGTGNPIDWNHCPAGNPGGIDQVGFGGSVVPGSGRGGESGVSTASLSQGRPGGGGGGAFAANQPVHPDPINAANLGRIAQAGQPGGAAAFGAVTLASPPPGGAAGLSIFVDGQPATDFFGIRFDLATQQWINGELLGPIGGFGGGGGGNRITGTSFPPTTAWTPTLTDKYLGAGGGAGGGLLILQSMFIVLGPNGRIVCNGGAGGSSAQTQSDVTNFDRLGGGGGGGSGGMILMQARRVDLHLASANSITALGGRGGRGALEAYGAASAGGNGGPGLIQIHVPNELTNLVLPQGVTLAQITAPTAFVCAPVQDL